MKKTCVYCGRVHSKEYVCTLKPVKRKTVSAKDKFRSTSAWQKKRNAIVERDMFMCRVCLENYKQGKLSVQQLNLSSNNLQVHHIVPLSADYSLRIENHNLITLCPVHHELAERGEIAAEYLHELADIPPAL